MEIKCGKCGFTSTGPDTLSGKKLKCPQCGEEFVANAECAFTVVEENRREPEKHLAAQRDKVIVEKPIGKIGELEVTNKRVHGTIHRSVTVGNATTTEKVNIDVLLNLITGITVRKVENPLGCVGAMCVCFGVFGFILGIVGIANNVEFVGGLGFFIGAILLISGCAMLSGDDKVHLVLSISGVDHFIPYETSQMKEAEEKCKMLQDAKREYERLVQI